VRAAGTGSGIPYAPLSAAVEQLVAGASGRLATLPDRTRSVPAELTPLAVAAPPLRGALTRHQVIAALRRVLWVTDPGPPTLLLVEDAHLCDEATADVIYEAGQAFYWEPGHAPVALEDCEYVDFSPTEAFRHVLDHVRGAGG